MGGRIKQRHLKVLFDEVDYIILNQVDFAVKEYRTLIKVICSETYDFVLLNIGPMQMFIWKIS